MKGPLGIVAAGGTFASAVIGASAIGWFAGERLHRGDLVIYGFFAGVVLGGYAAFRLVADAIRAS